jgi:transposase
VAAGLRWPLPATLTDRVLEAMLYAGHGGQQGARRKAEPDWAYVHHELRRPGGECRLSKHAGRTIVMYQRLILGSAVPSWHEAKSLP